MNIRTFVAILSRNPQYNFPKMRGGGQRPFGTFPKIHPFWSARPSLREAIKKKNWKKAVRLTAWVDPPLPSPEAVR